MPPTLLALSDSPGDAHAVRRGLERFRSVYAFITASVDQLTEIPGIGPKKAERIHSSIRWENSAAHEEHATYPSAGHSE